MAPSVLLVHEAGRFPQRSPRSESWVPPSSSPSCRPRPACPSDGPPPAQCSAGLHPSSRASRLPAWLARCPRS
eukprot:11018694-Heterocapsa_arctica.AAC.1